MAATLVLTTLEVTTPGDREIRLQRDFGAPRRLVFETLTRPELLKRWLLGPEGWRFEECQVDLRVGGAFRYLWRGPDGEVVGVRGVYHEVLPPRRLVHSQVFDEPWGSGETRVTTVLTERGGVTRLTSTLRYASREARDGAIASGMAAGMGAGYDRLAALLPQLSPSPET